MKNINDKLYLRDKDFLSRKNIVFLKRFGRTKFSKVINSKGLTQGFLIHRGEFPKITFDNYRYINIHETNENNAWFTNCIMVYQWIIKRMKENPNCNIKTIINALNYIKL